MKEEYLEYMVLLEKTIAEFYDNLQKKDFLHRIKSALDFMSVHSMGHAERIAETSAALSKPSLGRDVILNFQNLMTVKIAEDIIDNREPEYALQRLAEAEESLGNLYKNIASVMLELSEYYKKASAEVLLIADEEYGHRDILLNDIERLKSRSKK